MEHEFNWLWEVESHDVDAGCTVRVLCRDEVPPNEHVLDLKPLVGNASLWHIICNDPGHTVSPPFQATLRGFRFNAAKNVDAYTVDDVASSHRILLFERPLRRRLLVWRTRDALDMLVFWNWYENETLRIQYGGEVVIPLLAMGAASPTNGGSSATIRHVFEHGRLQDEELAQ